LKELVTQLSAISGDVARVMTRLKACYRSWAMLAPASKSMRRAIVRVAGKIREAGVRPSGGVLLPATRWVRSLDTSAARTVGGERQTPGVEYYSADSLDWSDPRGPADRDSCRPHTVSAPSGNCGRTAAGHRDATAAPIIVMSMEAVAIEEPVSLRGLTAITITI